MELNFSEMFGRLSAELSMAYIKIYQVIEEETKKKNNGEEYDSVIIEHGQPALMHLSHSMGELVEAKSHLVKELNPADILCKMQYEQEMSEALDAYTMSKGFNDILNDKNENDKNE